LLSLEESEERASASRLRRLPFFSPSGWSE